VLVWLDWRKRRSCQVVMPQSADAAKLLRK